MYGKIGIASGATAVTTMATLGTQAVAWWIGGAAASVLTGIMVYRLATRKDRRQSAP